MAKVWSNVMLVMLSVTMKSSNVRKIKGTIDCDISTVTCDFGTTQCDNGTVKCEEKIKVPPNVRKVRLNMMLVLPNITMKP